MLQQIIFEPLVLRHRIGLRYRFAVDLNCVDVVSDFINSLTSIKKCRFNSLSASLIIEFSPDFDFDSWLSSSNKKLTILALSNSSSTLSSFTLSDSELPPLIADGTQAEIAAALSSEKFDLLPTRLKLPLLALVTTTLALPLELPFFPVLLLVLLAGGRCFDRARSSLWGRRKLNVDVLDALAVVLHSIEGFLFGPALMLSMIEGGESIRDATARIAHSSTRSLKTDLETEVNVRRDDISILICIAEIEIGDVVLLFAGDQVPIDGIVLLGQSSLDVRSLTGESVPRFVEPGDDVLASSLVLEGSIEVSTTAVGQFTKAGQIAKLLEAAPVCDSRVGNYAAKVADQFVLPTLALSALSFGLFGSLSQAASLLMLDLGTGLRVSVPTSILASLNRAASNGILIRSGRALEALAEIDVVVFDKTGTLTTGDPELLHIEVLDSFYSQNDLLQLAASAEQGLNHPIAIAISNAAKSKKIALLTVDDWSCEIGRGVCASQSGRKLLVGNRRLLRDEGIDPPPFSFDSSLRVATEVIIAVDSRLAGVIYLADSLRSDSKELLRLLGEKGISCHILTGDSEAVALQVGQQLGLSRSQIHAEALPDVKADVVRRLKAEGHRVAFVGDGLNDSAALAYADVAVSFCHGSDIAKETAEIVLSGGNIIQLLEAYELSKFSFSIVKQNIAIVAVPNLTALVIGVLLPIPPIFAILINNGSCILAALNALRPLAHKPNITLPKPEIQDLELKQLAARLGTTSQKIVAKRSMADFANWSAKNDPQQYSWRYETKSKLFKVSSDF